MLVKGLDLAKQKLWRAVLAGSMALFGCSVALLACYYLKTFGPGNHRNLFLLIGISAVSALAMMLVVTLVRLHVAKKKGVRHPSLGQVMVVAMVAWVCLVIPSLFVVVAEDVGTRIAATLGGLSTFLVFFWLWNWRYRIRE